FTMIAGDDDHRAVDEVAGAEPVEDARDLRVRIHHLGVVVAILDRGTWRCTHLPRTRHECRRRSIRRVWIVQVDPYEERIGRRRAGSSNMLEPRERPVDD